MVCRVLSGQERRNRWISMGVCFQVLLQLGSGGLAAAAPEGAFSPTGKSFKERLTAFLADAKATYGVSISRKSESRKAEDAKKCHVPHMILYNSFASRKPARSEE